MPYDPNDPNNDPNNPNQNGQAVGADQASQTLAQQAASLTAAIKAGTVTPAQAQASLPSNTKIVNGIVVPNDPSLLPLFIIAAAVAAPFAVEGLTSLASAGGGAAAGAEGDAAATAAESAEAGGAAGAGGAGTTIGSLYGPLASGETGVGATTAALVPPADLVAGGSSAAAGGAAGAVAKAATTPNIWSSVIGLAGQGITSYLGANASKTAADQMANASMYAANLQATATANSLAFQKQQWEQAQANSAPFIKLGQQGATTLGNVLGFNGPVNPATAAPFTAGIPVNVGSAALSNVPQQRGTAQPSFSSLYSSAGTTGATTQGPQAVPSSTPSYVKISWADGSVDSVPASAVPQYQTLGAKVVA